VQTQRGNLNKEAQSEEVHDPWKQLVLDRHHRGDRRLGEGGVLQHRDASTAGRGEAVAVQQGCEGVIFDKESEYEESYLGFAGELPLPGFP